MIRKLVIGVVVALVGLGILGSLASPSEDADEPAQSAAVATSAAPASSGAGSSQSGSDVPVASSGEPQEFTGTGPSSTPNFRAPASTWQACYEMTSWATLSTGQAIGVIFVDVKRASDDRTVGRLAGDAEQAATRSGCTTIRDDGEFYFDVNTGASAAWTLTAR